MSTQRASELQVEMVLTAFSVGYKPGNLIAEQILPVVQHGAETGVYWKWDGDYAYDVPDTLIADGTRPKTIAVKATKVPFATEEYAVEATITDRERKNAANVLEMEQHRNRRAMDALLMDQERRVYNRLLTDVTQGATLAGNDKWSADDNESVEEQIDEAKEMIRVQTGGQEPNFIVIPRNATRHLKRNPYIRELLKYTHQDLLVNGELPPILWGLKVIIPGAIMNAGTTSADFQNIWGNNVLIGFKTDAPELESQSLGYIIREGDVTTYTYREDPIRTTFYRPTVQQTEVIAFPKAGYWLKSVI